MGKILILNGSPRAPKSNSREYARLFAQVCRAETDYYNITRTNHLSSAPSCGIVPMCCWSFPLCRRHSHPTAAVFEDAGGQPARRTDLWCPSSSTAAFWSLEQNDVAVEMIRLFCSQNGYPCGSVLKIGSGEAILATPFRHLVQGKLRKLAKSLEARKNQTYRVTMPLPKWMFLKASTVYWSNYGKRNGVSREQMATMKIEDQ